jgi:hypothetical protein
MTQAPITIGGIPIPSTSPVFLAVLGVHVVAGLTCVLTGLAAMVARKGPGRHSYFGNLYYRGLIVVFVSMGLLSAMRWAEDYHLFILGSLSFASAFVGRRVIRRSGIRGARVHLTGMGLSYIFLLTAFYVDNGAHLPLWRSLPPIAYWLVPGAIGVPLIIHTLRRHPLAQRTVPTVVGT